MKLRGVMSLLLGGVLALSLAGCGSTGKKDEKKGGKDASGDTSVVFSEAGEVTGYEGQQISGGCFDGKDLYFTSCTYEDASETDTSEGDASETDASEGDAAQSSFYVYRVTPGEDQAELVAGPVENVDSGYVLTDGEGNVSLFRDAWDFESGNSSYSLISFKKDGTTDKETDFTSVLQPPQGQPLYLSNVIMTPDGDIIMSGDESIYVLGQDGTKKKEIKSESYVQYICLDRDGNVLMEFMEDSGDSGSEDTSSEVVIRVFDPETGKFTKEYHTGFSYLQYDMIRGSGDYLFYCDTGTGIYGFTEDEKKEKILDYSASDINTGYITGGLMTSPEDMYAFWYDYDSSDAQERLVHYRKADPASVKEKKVLTCASLYGNQNLQTEIIAFNKAHSDIRINLISYDQENDPAAKMSADIAAGNVPDLYDITGGVGNMSLSQCIGRGFFEDLTPYLEKDPELSESDLIPQVADVLKREGKYWYFPSGFYLQTLMGKKSSIGSRTGWDFSEFRDYVKENDRAQLFAYGDPSTNLDTLMNVLETSFVDWEKGTCSFDSQDFRDLLEICASSGESGDSTEELAGMQDGSILFSANSLDVWTLVLYQKALAGDMSCIGYPTGNRKGICVGFNDGVAMSSGCRDKEAAWEFIRTFITKSYQGENYANEGGSMPTRADILEDYFKTLTCTESYTDEFGNKIDPVSGSSSMDDVEVEMKPFSEADIDLYRDALNRTGCLIDPDWEILSILREETEPYFQGDKSAEDTAKVIQDRVSTYISENK